MQMLMAQPVSTQILYNGVEVKYHTEDSAVCVNDECESCSGNAVLVEEITEREREYNKHKHCYLLQCMQASDELPC